MSLLQENRRTLILAAPIIAGHVGQMLMGWADTVMIGHVGVVPLAACAFANTVLAVFMIFGFGLLSSVSIRASQAFGAKDPHRVGEALAAGVVLGTAAGVLAALAIHVVLPGLHLLGQPAEVVAESRTYLLLIGWSMVPTLAAAVGKGYSEALSRPWLPFWFMMGGVALNVFLNWLWIYGNWGFPRLELDGAGYATLVARAVTFIALFAALWSMRVYAPYRAWFASFAALWRELSRLLRLGLPSGGQLLAEVSCFAFASLMMGWISVNALAAHQIAITCAATTFMFPLGLAIAVTVRIGQCVGAGQFDRIRPIAFGALGMAVALMAGFAVVFILGGGFLATLFVQDPEVIALTASLLMVAGIFQVFDGAQVLSMGALRGMADVRVPFILIVATYWGVAIPASAINAFAFDRGALGVWQGLAFGLAVAAAVLVARLAIRTRTGARYDTER